MTRYVWKRGRETSTDRHPFYRIVIIITIFMLPLFLLPFFLCSVHCGVMHRGITSCPTDLFTILKLRNPWYGVPELNKISWSPDFEALKLWKVRSGATYMYVKPKSADRPTDRPIDVKRKSREWIWKSARLLVYQLVCPLVGMMFGISTPRPTLSQTQSFRIRRATFLNNRKLSGLPILKL